MYDQTHMYFRAAHKHMGSGGALVEAMTFNRRVVGSTLALAAT